MNPKPIPIEEDDVKRFIAEEIFGDHVLPTSWEHDVRIHRIFDLIQTHTRQLEKELYLTRSDLAWCLGKLQGLGHPNELMEKKLGKYLKEEQL